MNRSTMTSGWVFVIIPVAVIVFVFAGSYFNAAGQGNPPTAETSYRELEDKIDTFFSELSSSTGTTPSTSPFQNLLKDGPLGSETEMFTKMSQNFANTKSFGPYREHELIDIRAIGKSKNLVIMRYLYKCEFHPVVWYFTFYRSPSAKTVSSSPTTGNWTIIGIKFDTNFENLVPSPDAAVPR